MRLTQAINKIKLGIQEGDEELIEEGFFLLTGEKVLFPDEDYSVPDNNKESLSDTPKVIHKSTNRADRADIEDFSMFKNKREQEKKKFVNNFNPESVVIEKEPDEDLINDKVKPVPRTRAAFKMTTVFCQDCHKNIEINPKFKKEPYYCDFIKCGQKCPNS
jgi:hypothetical protein